MIHVHNGGVWTPVRQYDFHNGGVWHTAQAVWIKVSGVWKLAHMQQSSFGGGTVDLNSDGTASGTSYSGNLKWYSPPGSTPGIGSSFWARTTRVSGSTGTHTSPADGVWRSLAAGIHYSSVSAAGSCNCLIEFALDSGGADIMQTGTLSVDNGV